MPHIKGYTIYVAPPIDGVRDNWLARAYRESDDSHVHSSEDAPSLGLALKEVGDAIVKNMAHGQT